MENTNKRHTGSQPEEGKRGTCGGDHPYHTGASERDCCPCVGMLRQQESRNLKIYKILTCPQAPQVSPMRVLSLRGKRNVGCGRVEEEGYHNHPPGDAVEKAGSMGTDPSTTQEAGRSDSL